MLFSPRWSPWPQRVADWSAAKDVAGLQPAGAGNRQSAGDTLFAQSQVGRECFVVNVAGEQVL